jgi:hypothetical protein
LGVVPREERKSGMVHRKGDMSKWNTEKVTCPNGTQKR